MGAVAAGDEADGRLLAAAPGLVGRGTARASSSAAPPISPIMIDRRGRRVGEEQFEHVDELRALDRIATDADGRVVCPEALARRLEDGLVCKRPGARDDPPPNPLLKMLPGMMPILQGAGRHHARGSSARSAATSSPRARA